MLQDYRDDGNGRPRLCQVSKIKKRDMMGIMGIVNDNKTKDEQCHLLHFEHKMGSGWTG